MALEAVRINTRKARDDFPSGQGGRESGADNRPELAK
ncbi:hypothetical protein H4W33_003498 [Kibdelosporangium phytohabitans]|nr:hypothetical protein [Kibdelosporangium phytohabitans]